MNNMAKKLTAAAKSAPPICDPQPVIKVLDRLPEGLADGSAPPVLTPSSFEGTGLTPADSAFLNEHVPSQNGILKPTGLDPFPLDRAALGTHSIPDGSVDRQALGWSVMEHLNRVRTDPSAYAAHLRARMRGCYEGTTFAPPWQGGKVRTVEGEAGLEDLCKHLEALTPLPEIQLLAPLVDAAFDYATELATSPQGQAGSALEGRLAKYGTWSGVAGEALVYASRQPEAIVVSQLLS